MLNLQQKLMLTLTALTMASSAHAARDVRTGVDANGSVVVFTEPELRHCEAVERRLVTEEINRVYDNAFPAYIEFCAASTWQKRGATDGGNFGHAFGLIHGACVAKDWLGRRLVPQQLVPCKGGTVGISTEGLLFNHQWVAADTRSLMLYGNHDPARPFDVAAWKRVQDSVFKTGTFTGLEVRPYVKVEVTKKAEAAGVPFDEYYRNWLADFTFGTEFALASARGGVDCTRIPLNGSKPGAEDKPLKDVLNYLNALNRKAFQDAKIVPPGRVEPTGFDYDVVVNNCAHTVYQALAELGFWPKKNTEGHPGTGISALSRVDDAVAPYNSMFEAYQAGSRFNINDLITRFRTNKADFDYFKQTGWLGQQVGTMIDTIPPLSFMNSIYDITNRTLFASIPGAAQMLVQQRLNRWITISLPIYQPLKAQFDAIKADRQGPGMDVVTNLYWWRGLYRLGIERLEARPDQDEVIIELISHFRTKLAQTESLLARKSELTANPVQPQCRDDVDDN